MKTINLPNGVLSVHAPVLPLDLSGHVLGRAADDEAFGPVVVPRGEAVAAARQLGSNVGFLRE